MPSNGLVWASKRQRAVLADLKGFAKEQKDRLESLNGRDVKLGQGWDGSETRKFGIALYTYAYVTLYAYVVVVINS